MIKYEIYKIIIEQFQNKNWIDITHVVNNENHFDSAEQASEDLYALRTRPEYKGSQLRLSLKLERIAS